MFPKLEKLFLGDFRLIIGSCCMIGSITSRCSGDEPDTREQRKSSLAVWLKLMDPLIIGQNWLADQASSQTKKCHFCRTNDQNGHPSRTGLIWPETVLSWADLRCSIWGLTNLTAWPVLTSGKHAHIEDLNWTKCMLAKRLGNCSDFENCLLNRGTMAEWLGTRPCLSEFQSSRLKSNR